MSQANKKQTPVRCLTEGGICVALSLALSYLKIPIMAGFGGFGGSIDFVMIPLIIFAVRWGAGWGIGAGLVFGTLKYFMASGGAISWISIIFDYAVAYAFVGFAGLFRKKYALLPVAALIGMFAFVLLSASAAFAVHLKANAAASAAGVVLLLLLPAIGNYYMADALSKGGVVPWSYVGCAALAAVPAVLFFLFLGIHFINGRDVS